MEFECRQCGACCKPGWVGVYQAVNINNREQKMIGKALGLSVDELCARYNIKNDCVNTSHTACSFLVDDVCSIHDVKPTCCERWPWIGANETLKGQIKSAARCPGIILEDSADWNKGADNENS